ncbi:hypothetical protein COLO4_33988 [Corchorus olitorius]|uniref:Uncharacterized protein n=1 Tax=Corchorus olitorius TaxID=93759 RepID=A0A1R3GPG5_9ROSI|nr:hypothetical protein COLO4_33988 [Corchorus olitorius]
MWSIWIARNDMIFNNKYTSIDQICDLIRIRLGWWLKAKYSNADFAIINFLFIIQEISFCPTANRSIVIVFGTPPPPNHWKINVDGSSLGKPGLAGIVIRINVEDWLRSQKFESKNDHVSVANPANTEAVEPFKALARLPNPIIPPSVDIVNPNHLTVENIGCSPCSDDELSDDPNAVLDQDQDYYLVNLDGYGTPGSPCFSVHSRSIDEINMILEEEANYRIVSVEFGNVDNVLNSGQCCDGQMTLSEGECESLDDVINDNESLKVTNGLLSTSRNTESAMFVSDSEMTTIRMSYIDESVVALESIVDHTLKKPRQRKKRKNHYWSRKKTHTKANHAMVVYNGPPEINEIDNHISDDDIAHLYNVLRNEARKVLVVGKLLGIAFVDDNEVIINELVELEGQDG